MRYKNRQEAGQKLSEELLQYKDSNDAVILALVRGGVVIGRALAEALHLPLYPYIVRKIGHPEDREFAIGALAEGGETFLDDATMQMCSLSWEDIEPIIEEESQELKRRQKEYLADARPDLKSKTIILTDDGAATGATLFAAIADLRKAGVKELIVTLPVCAPDTAAKLKVQADKTVILMTPEPFHAVGVWYQIFPQVEDEEVMTMLQSTADTSPAHP